MTSRIPFDFTLTDARHRSFAEGRRDALLSLFQVIAARNVHAVVGCVLVGGLLLFWGGRSLIYDWSVEWRTAEALITQVSPVQSVQTSNRFNWWYFYRFTTDAGEGATGKIVLDKPGWYLRRTHCRTAWGAPALIGHRPGIVEAAQGARHADRDPRGVVEDHVAAGELNAQVRIHAHRVAEAELRAPGAAAARDRLAGGPVDDAVEGRVGPGGGGAPWTSWASCATTRGRMQRHEQRRGQNSSRADAELSVRYPMRGKISTRSRLGETSVPDRDFKTAARACRSPVRAGSAGSRERIRAAPIQPRPPRRSSSSR